MCQRASIRMRGEPAAVPAARHWTSDQLGALYTAPAGAREDAALLVSELVSNCVGAGADYFELAIEAHHDSVQVAATDDAAGLPSPAAAGPADRSGRGLLIIDRLAAEWGVEPAPVGKTVWATLRLPAHAHPNFPCHQTTG